MRIPRKMGLKISICVKNRKTNIACFVRVVKDKIVSTKNLKHIAFEIGE